MQRSLCFLPIVSFTWNFSYPFIANRERERERERERRIYESLNFTPKSVAKIFRDPGARTTFPLK